MEDVSGGTNANSDTSVRPEAVVKIFKNKSTLGWVTFSNIFFKLVLICASFFPLQWRKGEKRNFFCWCSRTFSCKGLFELVHAMTIISPSINILLFSYAEHIYWSAILLHFCAVFGFSRGRGKCSRRRTKSRWLLHNIIKRSNKTRNHDSQYKMSQSLLVFPKNVMKWPGKS